MHKYINKINLFFVSNVNAHLSYSIKVLHTLPYGWFVLLLNTTSLLGTHSRPLMNWWLKRSGGNSFVWPLLLSVSVICPPRDFYLPSNKHLFPDQPLFDHLTNLSFLSNLIYLVILTFDCSYPLSSFIYFNIYPLIQSIPLRHFSHSLCIIKLSVLNSVHYIHLMHIAN